MNYNNLKPFTGANDHRRQNGCRKGSKNLISGRSDFLNFALEYIDNMGQHFFELPLEEVAVCKNILFPSGFWVDSNKIVYTPEISPLYRERTTKMGSLNPENCPVVGCEGLEPPTFSV